MSFELWRVEADYIPQRGDVVGPSWVCQTEAQAVELAAATEARLLTQFGDAHPATLTARMHHGAARHRVGESARAVAMLRATHAAQDRRHAETVGRNLNVVEKLGEAEGAPRAANDAAVQA